MISIEHLRSKKYVIINFVCYEKMFYLHKSQMKVETFIYLNRTIYRFRAEEKTFTNETKHSIAKVQKGIRKCLKFDCTLIEHSYSTM